PRARSRARTPAAPLHHLPPPLAAAASSPVRPPRDLSVTEVCFAVGGSSLGTFSTRFTELVGMPPSTYRRLAADATEGMPACVAKQVTRPVRNQEAPGGRAPLA
ncbi:hypothetical protein ACFVIN_29565, partial [Streptomyces prasinus]